MKYQPIGKTFVFENTNRRFGSATHYVGVRVVTPDGKIKTLMFTENEMDNAYERACKNPEDQIKAVSLFQKFVDWLHI